MAAEGIVLVTGGSRGIGAATATLLAGQDHRVVVTDIAPEPLAGTQVILWPAPFDVASESAVVSGIADIESAHGPITGLVNAAGIFGKMNPIERVRMEQWDREVDIDLRGTFLVARSVGVKMAERRHGATSARIDQPRAAGLHRSHPSQIHRSYSPSRTARHG